MSNDAADKQQQLAALRQQMAELEAELQSTGIKTWQRSEGPFYSTYYAWAGAILGMFGAAASLLFNVIGSLAVNQHPLKLIQVYATFPLGERMLEEGMDSGMVLALGCCLYILTGMVLAIPLHLLMARYLPHAKLGQRLVFATVAGLLLWAVNFYLILSWLQPWICGGNWITDPAVLPPWIGAATHVVFAWVVAALFPWGTMQERATGQLASQQTI